MGFYQPHVLVGDIKRHRIAVVGVTINRSGVRCLPGDATIHLGLTMVRSIGEELARAIVAEREANGSYRSLPDLLRRTNLPSTAAENLIVVGALGEFGLSRRDLLWQLGLLRPRSVAQRPGSDAKQLRPAASGPGARPGQLALPLPVDQDMVQLKDLSAWERMASDYRVLDLSPSAHPLGLLRRRLPSNILTAAGLGTVPDGVYVRTAGLVVCRQRPRTAKGFIFLLLEDETGLTNVVVPPGLYEAERSVFRGELFLCVGGTLQNRSGSLNLLAKRVAPLAKVLRALPPRPLSRPPNPAVPDPLLRSD